MPTYNQELAKNDVQPFTELSNAATISTIWIALDLRYNNDDYSYLKLWDMNHQRFSDFLGEIIKPMITRHEGMKTYLGDIWVTLDGKEYQLEGDIQDFVCKQTDIQRLQIRLDVFHASESDRQRVC